MQTAELRWRSKASQFNLAFGSLNLAFLLFIMRKKMKTVSTNLRLCFNGNIYYNK